MACNESPESSSPVDVEFKIIDKYKELMVASIGEDSIYERSKNTIVELSKDLNLTEKERMEIVAGQITQMSVGITSNAMNAALAYAEKSVMLGYDAALQGAQASKALTDAKVSAKNICLVDKEIQYKCAQTTAVLAGSMRDNGSVASYQDSEKCIPLRLKDEGLKYEQTLQVDASKYQILADTFRKSGVVHLGWDGDSQLKGLTGTNDGHTYSQMNIADRQLLSFEDSKRNHAANSSAQTIGQIISAEGEIDPTLSALYVSALQYLTQDAPEQIKSSGSEILAPATISFVGSDTDTVSGTQMTNQITNDRITAKLVLGTSADYRIGDRLVFKSDVDGYATSHTLTGTDITNEYVIVKLKSVTLTANTSGIESAVYNLSVRSEDAGGNYSATNTATVVIKYDTLI